MCMTHPCINEVWTAASSVFIKSLFTRIGWLIGTAIKTRFTFYLGNCTITFVLILVKRIIIWRKVMDHIQMVLKPTVIFRLISKVIIVSLISITSLVWSYTLTASTPFYFTFFSSAIVIIFGAFVSLLSRAHLIYNWCEGKLFYIIFIQMPYDWTQHKLSYPNYYCTKSAFHSCWFWS